MLEKWHIPYSEGQVKSIWIKNVRTNYIFIQMIIEQLAYRPGKYVSSSVNLKAVR